MFNREIRQKIERTLSSGKSVLIFGARQTGKTTLSKTLLIDHELSMLRPNLRHQYSLNPDRLIQELEALQKSLSKKPLVLIDEIQKAPNLLDVVQYLIDNQTAQFILTGSSARKLRMSSELNLLPGRVIVYHMDPLTLNECPENWLSLDHLLYDGSLPDIVNSASEIDRYEILESYASIYLEEEVRSEALVKNVDSFIRFLELAARESGEITNHSKLSQQIGVTHVTVKTYYQILVDSLVAFRISPYTKSSYRKRLTKSSKIIFFDLGVRRLCAHEGKQQPLEAQGKLLEQLVGLELVRYKHLHKEMMNILFWRDSSGVEVDYVIEKENQLIPIEVKLTDTPKSKDARHLETFISEYDKASKGFILCNCNMPMKITKNVMALPWKEMLDLFKLALQKT
jgi:predicted AAA+ superfamily ATPase